MSTVIDRKILSIAEGRQMVAYARVQGWLPPDQGMSLFVMERSANPRLS
jgi:hypothetical protein